MGYFRTMFPRDCPHTLECLDSIFTPVSQTASETPVFSKMVANLI